MSQNAKQDVAQDAGKQDAGTLGAGKLDRRAFLAGAGSSAFVVPFAVSFSGTPAEAATVAAPIMLNAYLKIDASNVVTLMIGSTEMGQGIMTGLAQLVADEMALSWSQVRVEHALVTSASPNPYANPLFQMQLTGGSTSMRGWYAPIRNAAAIARQTLMGAANRQFGGTWSVTAGGKVASSADATKTHLFSELVSVASTLLPVTSPSVTLATTTNFIGKRIPRTDLPAKINGTAVFGIDVQVPGMLFASVVHCPTLGGTVSKMPAKPSGAVAIVNLTNAVGVIATDTYSAMTMARALVSQVTWKLPTSLAASNSATVMANAQTLLTSTSVVPHIYETQGSVDPVTAIAAATKSIDVTYQLPFLAHACMEVLNCTASVTSTSCEIWAPTQGQSFVIPTAQAITGLTADKITVHTTYLGGGFGRKIEQDYVAQAITLSKAVAKPVKLTWSRPQDFQNDKYRPCAAIRVRAGLDVRNGIVGFAYRNASPSINIQRNTVAGNNPEDTGAVAGALALPYTMANRRIEYTPVLTDIPLGYWRSVGESYNTFAVESAIDELARAAAQDPMAFRKTLLASDARALGVLNAVDTLSGWSTSAVPAGRGRGVAFLSGFGSYIALVVQIVLDSSSKIRVEKVFCAIDCGIAINPDLIEAQMQGGIAQGITSTLWSGVNFVNGVPQVSNFSNYRVLRASEMPIVSVAIVPSTQAPGGVGETGVPCVAPAIANAYAALSGTRVRSLPFYPGATMSDG